MTEAHVFCRVYAEGLLTIIAGVASFWVIQDFPDSARVRRDICGLVHLFTLIALYVFDFIPDLTPLVSIGRRTCVGAQGYCLGQMD